MPPAISTLRPAKTASNYPDPALFLKQFEDRFVILDEIHRVPELFPVLRGLIDLRTLLHQPPIFMLSRMGKRGACRATLLEIWRAALTA